MKCYMIVLGAFTDFERFMTGYQQVVGPMGERLGGHYVLMGGGTEVLEGAWSDRAVTGTFQVVLVDAEGFSAAP